MPLALPMGDFHQKDGDIHNRWFEVLFQELVQYDDNRTKKG
jgi:hypothetical protein